MRVSVHLPSAVQHGCDDRVGSGLFKDERQGTGTETDTASDRRSRANESGLHPPDEQPETGGRQCTISENGIRQE